jgi:DNA-binding GntR family transcriptional regulator
VTSDAYLSKTDVVFESLRELITNGQMAPGEPLRQRDLAARFNVSPTPVREALWRLEAAGLVISDLHRGSRVANTEDDDEEESNRILATLEPLATTLAVERMTDEDLAEIRVLQRRFDECPEDDPAVTALNREFHFRIYECARSPLLLSLMRILWQSFAHRPRLWRPHTDSVREHDDLVAALEDRDSERAATVVRDHVLGSIDWMRTALAGAEADELSS